jgi:hypothetical protein
MYLLELTNVFLFLLGCYGNFIPANQVSGAAVHWHNEWGGRHWMQDCMWIFVCTIIIFTV